MDFMKAKNTQACRLYYRSMVVAQSYKIFDKNYKPVKNLKIKKEKIFLIR